MQTYTIEDKQLDLVKLINEQANEPIIIRNKKGNDFLLMPFSGNKKLDNFLLFYKSFNDLIKPNLKEQKKREVSKMTAKEFTDKWLGFMKGAEISENYKDEYYEFLNKKHQ